MWDETRKMQDLERSSRFKFHFLSAHRFLAWLKKMRASIFIDPLNCRANMAKNEPRRLFVFGATYSCPKLFVGNWQTRAVGASLPSRKCHSIQQACSRFPAEYALGSCSVRSELEGKRFVSVLVLWCRWRQTVPYSSVCSIVLPFRSLRGVYCDYPLDSRHTVNS